MQAANPPRAAGHRWQAFARSVIENYAGICHICGHGGARQAEHLIPVTERPDLMFSMANCRPAHGAGRGTGSNPCPACSAEARRPIFCNGIKGMGSTGRARRIIAGYIQAAKRGEVPVPRAAGYTAGKSPPESGITGEPGRDW